MDKSTIESNHRLSKILKIETIGENQYRVFFDFLDTPVTMNKKFLESITDDLNIDRYSRTHYIN